MKFKIVLGVTAPLSVVLLKGQLRYFSALGYDVYLLAPKTKETLDFCSNENATLLPVSIEREINLFSDIISLIVIYSHLIKIKPNIINVGTPKMGLLGSLAAWFARVPQRYFTCRGFRFEHEKGLKRFILKVMDKLAVKFSHKVICISASVEQLGINEGMFTKQDSIIFGNGSSNGLDLAFYNRDNYNQVLLEQLKSQIGVSGKFIFGFVGRIVDRKGVNELYAAFAEINKDYPKTHLLIVGKANLEQVSDATLIDKLESDVNVTMTGYVNNVNDYLAIMDVFVLPAWWEGFGNTLIQAAAMGLPIISCDVTGCKDAVKHDYNGILIPPRNTPLLKEKMMELMHDRRRRDFFGDNGKKWAINFDSNIIWKEMKELYET
jgi:glycosyltransferase involved in cell wall biosynthesis